MKCPEWLYRKHPELGSSQAILVASEVAADRTYPKWLYRKHPEIGSFQQTLVASEQAATELSSDWTDNPAEHGFAVRPVSQMHPSHHVGENLVLHEVVTDSSGKPVAAEIAVTMKGDFPNVL